MWDQGDKTSKEGGLQGLDIVHYSRDQFSGVPFSIEIKREILQMFVDLIAQVNDDPLGHKIRQIFLAILEQAFKHEQANHPQGWKIEQEHVFIFNQLEDIADQGGNQEGGACNQCSTNGPANDLGIVGFDEFKQSSV